MSSLIKFLLMPILSLLLTTSALCTPSSLNDVLLEMHKVGSASFKFLFWSVYEAELYADQQFFSFTPLPVFILNINYQRTFKSDQLIKEIEKQLIKADPIQVELHRSWINKLVDILSDVEKGDMLSLYVDENQHSSFYLNLDYLGTIDDEKFSISFSSIWLARNDHYANFSRELTGIKQ